MAEAVVGLLASVGQLMDYTLKVCDYADQVRNAPAEKAAIAREASCLFATLTRLRQRLGLGQAQNTLSGAAWLAAAQKFHPAMNELSDDLGKLLTRLEHSRIRWPWDARRCQQTLGRMERLQSIMQLNLTETSMAIAEQKLDAIDQNVTTLVDDNERNWWTTVRSFFSNTGSSIFQQNLFESSLPGSGSWLLKHPTFMNWIAGKGETLWCPGIRAGAGKTMIASTIINHLEQKFGNDGSIGIAFIYFKYSETYGELQLLSDIYVQLLQRHHVVPDLTKTYLERYQREGKRPTCGELKDLLQSALKLYARSFIVLDALDECVGDKDMPVEKQTQFRRRFYQTLQSLGSSVNLLVTSRVSENLPHLFRDKMQLEISPLQNDMRAYIEQRIDEDGGSRPWTKMCLESEAFKDRSVKAIITKAQKMFLMVKLHVDSLMQQTYARHVEPAMQSLPTGLFKTYDEAMARIAKQTEDQRKRAQRVFMWVAFALRPLTTLELQHAEAIDVAECAFDERDLQSIDSLLSCCAGLVVADPSDGSVRFVHYTTLEYFQAAPHKHFPDAQTYLTQACLTYLLLADLESSQNDWNRDRLHEKHPLIGYAACYWGYHAHRGFEGYGSPAAAERDAMVQSLALSLLEKPKRVSDQFYVNPLVEDRNSIPAPPPLEWQVSGQPSGVHIAAGFGLELITDSLFNSGLSLDLWDERGYTPLHGAVLNGQANVVHYLAEQGADINATDHRFSATPLMVAAVTGRVEIARYLLSRGANVNAVGNDELPTTALAEACWFGWTDIVQLLLDHGAKTSSAEDGSATTRQWSMAQAAFRGRADIVEILARNGCRLDGSNGYMALRETLRARSLGCLKALTTAQVDATYTPEGEPSIMDLATLAGDWLFIQHLLQQRPNAPTSDAELQRQVMGQLNRRPWFTRTRLTRATNTIPDSNTRIKLYRRDEEYEYDQNTRAITYLALVVPDDVATVKKIIFRSDSHDQGWCDHPGAGNYTWFEASIQGRAEGDQYFNRWLFHNRLASAEYEIHETTWSCDHEDEAIASCVREIAPGAILQVKVMARFSGWVNWIRSFEVEIHHL